MRACALLCVFMWLCGTSVSLWGWRWGCGVGGRLRKVRSVGSKPSIVTNCDIVVLEYDHMNIYLTVIIWGVMCNIWENL